MARSLNAEIRRRSRAREYGGATHKRTRAALDPVVQGGLADCAICGFPIPPGPWHLAHNETRTGYKGPAHVRCNCNTQGSQPEPKSRDW